MGLESVASHERSAGGQRKKPRSRKDSRGSRQLPRLDSNQDKDNYNPFSSVHPCVPPFRARQYTSYADLVFEIGMSGPDRRLFSLLALETGLRVNELRSLTRCTLYWDAGFSCVE